MEIDLSKKHEKTRILVQTKDWGMYIIKEWAIPYVEGNPGVFTGAQNAGIESAVKMLNKYNNLWVMKFLGDSETSRDPIDPIELIRNKLITEVPDNYFERIFNVNEIRKISCEPIEFWDNKQFKGMYELKAPKTNLVGKFGAYLDNKF